GPRRGGRHRVSEEYRLRRLLQRGAFALSRENQHAVVYRDAGLGGTVAFEDGAERYGRPTRHLARWPVRKEPQILFLPEADRVRHGPGHARPVAARRDRQ